MKYVLVAFAAVLFADIAFAQAVVDPIFVPPNWLETILLAVKGLPLVGPYVVEALKWIGVAAAILTTLAGASISILKVLSEALSLVKLEELALKVAALQDSKFMYWLKYFSNFNAKPVVK